MCPCLGQGSDGRGAAAGLPHSTAPNAHVPRHTSAHAYTHAHADPPMPSDCPERGVDHPGDAVGGGALLAALLTTTAPALDSAYSPPLGQ